MLQMRNAVHLDFDRDRNLLFHFFCGTPRPLGDDLNPRVRNVRISLHGQFLECNRSPNKKKQSEAQDNETVVEREIDKLANHYCSTVFWNCSAFRTTRWP